MSFVESAISSTLMTLVSEFGDKTFFVAAILSANFRSEINVVYLACWSSLACMTILSGGLGFLLKYFNYIVWFIPSFVPGVVSALLLSSFAIEMFNDAFEETDELAFAETEEEAKEQISNSYVSENVLQKHVDKHLHKVNSILGVRLKSATVFFFLKTFITNVMAEMGDKSQFTTVAVASASHSVSGVVFGGILGHALCTGLAVLFGALLLQMLSKKHVDLVGAVLFFVFALRSLYMAFK